MGGIRWHIFWILQQTKIRKRKNRDSQNSKTVKSVNFNPFWRLHKFGTIWHFIWTPIWLPEVLFQSYFAILGSFWAVEINFCQTNFTFNLFFNIFLIVGINLADRKKVENKKGSVYFVVKTVLGAATERKRQKAKRKTASNYAPTKRQKLRRKSKTPKFTAHFIYLWRDGGAISAFE